MPYEETVDGMEVVASPSMMKEIGTISMHGRSPTSLLKNNTTWSMTTDISNVSSESRSYELEYSDEDLSITSDDAPYDEDFDDNNRDAKSDDVLQNFEIDFPSIRTLDLVIDEMPAPKSKAFLTNSAKAKSSATIIHSSFCKEVSKDQVDMVTACPCCRSYVDYVEAKKRHKFPIPLSQREPSPSAMSSFMDSLWPSQSEDSEVAHGEDSSSMLKSVDYTIKSCIIMGWLEKKGTGNDLFRNTYWKPRWCRLVVRFNQSCYLFFHAFYSFESCF